MENTKQNKEILLESLHIKCKQTPLKTNILIKLLKKIY